uniref:G-protein coupled receptors family 1 profile domain-containing protein n=1 Tax=Branchiostoma floridae TaxID=7739 RepID=C3ZGJ5_BRAFL|eukprot:XP_002592320.1 hypothetical protein BRAFLDRAFT_101264 [Branchiostoma floridae]
MFNNSSDPWKLTGETSAPEFVRLQPCYKWHLQNKTVTIAQADAACSMHEDLVRLGTGTEIWLLGLLIIISNAVVFLGIIGTRELHRPIYIYLANLTMADIFAVSFHGSELLLNMLERRALIFSMKKVVRFLRVDKKDDAAGSDGDGFDSV